jgi:hypothetical protein
VDAWLGGWGDATGHFPCPSGDPRPGHTSVSGISLGLVRGLHRCSDRCARPRGLHVLLDAGRRTHIPGCTGFHSVIQHTFHAAPLWVTHGAG